MKRLIFKLRQTSRKTISNRLKAAFRNPHQWPLLPFAIPVVLAIRLIRPWLLVRWGGLNTWRIGHLAILTELRLCEEDAGINKPSQRYVDIFFVGRTVCNEQLAKMFVRVHRIWPHWIHAPIERANRLIPGGVIHEIGPPSRGGRDSHNLLDRFPPHIKFTPEEEACGQEGLRNIGIPTGTPFVCLIARDSAYLEAIWGNAGHHSFRDSDIQNYVLAAEELADRGYFVIRMGAKVRETIKSNHPRIIDYATNGMRSDFMDIYLGAKCDFCVTSGCGFDCVPLIFRRPIASANIVPIGYLWTAGTQLTSITRHHYSVQKGRELTLKEIFKHGAGAYGSTADYESSGIRLIENTPEEIRDLVVENVERLNGTWQPQEGDEELQRKFWEIYPTDGKTNEGGLLHGEIRSHFGAAFLRENPDWLT